MSRFPLALVLLALVGATPLATATPPSADICVRPDPDSPYMVTVQTEGPCGPYLAYAHADPHGITVGVCGPLVLKCKVMVQYYDSTGGIVEIMP